MKIKRITFSVTSSAFVILMLAGLSPAVLAVDTETHYNPVAVIINGFGEAKNTKTMLFGKQALRALTSNSEGIQLWRAVDQMASDWEQISDALVTADPTNTDVVEVVGFKRFVYTVLNGKDGFEVWRWSRTTAWENVYEQHGQKTHATFLIMLSDGRLYLGLTSEESGHAQLLRSMNGKDWQMYGAAGLSNNVSTVNAIASVADTMIAACEDGKILRKERNADWVVVYEGTEPVTTLEQYRNPSMILAGIASANGAMVLKSTDGVAWTQVGTAGFGDADNTRITHFSGSNAPHGMIRAFTQNAVDGFQIWETSRSGDLTTWALYQDTADIGITNTATSKIMRYKGKLFGSTVNATEGSVVYRLEKVEE